MADLPTVANPGVPSVATSPTIPASGGIGLPVTSPLAGDAPPAPPAVPAPLAPVPPPAPLAPAPPPAPPQTVPLERLNEVIHQRQDLEERLGAAEDQLSRIQGAVGGESQQGSAADVAARQQEFYDNPQLYIDKRLAEVSQATQTAYPAAQEAMGYELMKRNLRQLHGVNSEVENQVVAAIRQYGLQGVVDASGNRSREGSIRTAYRMVTGKNIDDVVMGARTPGETVQQTLPPAGGTAVPAGGQSLQALIAMTPAQVEQMGPQAWVNQAQAAVAQQPA